jgi:hypothetical protein
LGTTYSGLTLPIYGSIHLGLTLPRGNKPTGLAQPTACPVYISQVEAQTWSSLLWKPLCWSFKAILRVVVARSVSCLVTRLRARSKVTAISNQVIAVWVVTPCINRWNSLSYIPNDSKLNTRHCRNIRYSACVINLKIYNGCEVYLWTVPDIFLKPFTTCTLIDVFVLLNQSNAHTCFGTTMLSAGSS